MAAGEYRSEGVLIRADDSVLEMFSRTALGSLRLPIEWVSAGLQPQKHDLILVEIGLANDPDAPFFAPPALRNAAFNFRIPAVEETTLRTFLESAALAAGRVV